MPHVFQSSLGRFLAAEQSLNAIGDFLHRRVVNGIAPDTNQSDA
jgi:hypothetical protein